ncbi:MAG: class I SAM-dependent RNA methyltransferase, partial [Saprospiraceae bacterium]|nr:class I SAM-dependent RNA methyltransferase [Saprospiraceae bacterium]
MAKKHYILPEIPIHGIADRGKGVGRSTDGIAVFVEGAVPGDVVDVFVQKKKKGFIEGVADRIVTPSPDRVEAFCGHFSICGGCKWQNLDYSAQLRHKQQVVEDALFRIGKVEVAEMLPIVGAPEITYYRNKLEFGFSNRRWLLAEEIGNPDLDPGHALGFHRAGFFDKIIDIQHCWLQAEPSNAIRNACRAIAMEQGLEFYDLRAHT